MADADQVSVLKRLYTTPYEFQFFQAVRLLGRLPDALARQEAEKSDLRKEVARFRTHRSLSFAASEIHSLQTPVAPLVLPNMTVTFMGLFGTYGVLPWSYTTRILELERKHRSEPGMEYNAFAEWLDIFNHRMIWFFYRAWEKYRFPIPFERGEYRHPRNPDMFTQAMLAILGLGQDHLRDRIRISYPDDADPPREMVVYPFQDLALFRFGGLLSQQHRNAWGLQSLLEGVLNISVEVQQFRGQWLPIEPSSRFEMGVLKEDGTGGELGENITVGDRVWHVQGKITLRLGPLTYREFLEFLPDREPVPERKSFLLLSQLARLYLGPELDVDVQLVLKAAEVPACRLTDDPVTGPHLGWTCWLIMDKPTHDADEAVFDTIETPWLDPQL